MANVIKSGGSIEVNTIGADWDYGAVYTTGRNPKLASLTFIPGADGDKLVVKEETDAGPVIFRASCASAHDEKIKYFYGMKRRPYVDFGDCVLSAGHKFLIDLWKD